MTSIQIKPIPRSIPISSVSICRFQSDLSLVRFVLFPFQRVMFFSLDTVWWDSRNELHQCITGNATWHSIFANKRHHCWPSAFYWPCMISSHRRTNLAQQITIFFPSTWSRQALVSPPARFSPIFVRAHLCSLSLFRAVSSFRCLSPGSLRSQPPWVRSAWFVLSCSSKFILAAVRLDLQNNNLYSAFPLSASDLSAFTTNITTYLTQKGLKVSQNVLNIQIFVCPLFNVLQHNNLQPNPLVTGSRRDLKALVAVVFTVPASATLFISSLTSSALSGVSYKGTPCTVYVSPQSLSCMLRMNVLCWIITFASGCCHNRNCIRQS